MNNSDETDNKSAPLPAFPAWAPLDFVERTKRMNERLSSAERSLHVRLLTDDRMRPVWAWHSMAKLRATNEAYGRPLWFFMNIETAMHLPGKPGNLTKAKRDEYFSRVRQHTKALIELLTGTYFSSNAMSHRGMGMIGIDAEELAATVVRDLDKNGEDDQGHIVAYHVDTNGVSRLPFNYPNCQLLDQLYKVLEWTTLEDGWDGEFSTASSRPIRHANTKSARIIFFTCNLFDSLDRYGMTIPFPHLATIANVALGLTESDQVDEETVRRQVRRYQDKQREAQSSQMPL